MIPRLGYIPGNSWLHRLDPRTKLVGLLCNLILIIYYDTPAALGILLFYILTSFVMAGLSPRLIFRKARFLLMFGLFIFLSYIIFIRDGQALLTLALPFKLGTWTPALIVTEGAVLAGLTVTLRFLDIVLLSLLFVAVTDPAKLAHGLMRSGLPYRYGFMLILALRFIPLFDMESSAVQSAQRARGLDLDSRGPRKIWRLAKYTFYPLLASALSRVDSISMSMEGRAFGLYGKRTYLVELKAKKADWFWAVFWILTTSGFIIFKNQLQLLIPLS